MDRLLTIRISVFSVHARHAPLTANCRMVWQPANPVRVYPFLYIDICGSWCVPDAIRADRLGIVALEVLFSIVAKARQPTVPRRVNSSPYRRRSSWVVRVSCFVRRLVATMLQLPIPCVSYKHRSFVAHNNAMHRSCRPGRISCQCRWR